MSLQQWCEVENNLYENKTYCFVYLLDSVTPIRLQGGPKPFAGRVEIYSYEQQTWMGVCDDYYGFTLNDAEVLCNMIGKPNKQVKNPISFTQISNVFCLRNSNCYKSLIFEGNVSVSSSLLIVWRKIKQIKGITENHKYFIFSNYNRNLSCATAKTWLHSMAERTIHLFEIFSLLAEITCSLSQPFYYTSPFVHILSFFSRFLVAFLF